MHYKWSKKAPLNILTAKGHNNVLQFTAGPERAVVYLDNNRIAKVLYFCDKKKENILHQDAHHIIVGDNNWQREVYHFLKPGGVAPTMRLGYTVHNGRGSWSSLPHDFEKTPEPGFEEIFFYRLQGGSERGIQVGKGLWCDGTKVDEVWFVSNNTFGVVPMGYHPLVGEPGVQVMYVWVYLAKTSRWEKV